MPLQAGKMYRPTDVAVDIATNSVYVVEQFNHRISKWDYDPAATPPANFVFTLDAGHVTGINIDVAGTGYQAFDQIVIGPPTLDIANPQNAFAVVATVGGSGEILTINMSDSGNGYDPNNLPSVVADETTGSGAILTAVVSTPWGNNGNGTTGVGAPVTSTTDNSLYRPTGIVLDRSNTRLYLTDTFHHRLRVINPVNGAFTSSTGKGGGATTDFYRPAGIAYNVNNSNILISDEFNRRGERYDVGDPPTFAAIAQAPQTGGGLSFIRPHGAGFDDTLNEDYLINDSQRGLMSKYNENNTNFEGQIGTPTADSTLADGLYFPGSGHFGDGLSQNYVFANTKSHAIKGKNFDNLSNVLVAPGTTDGKLHSPESVLVFEDTASYMLVANTLNNRIEVFERPTTFKSNFGSP